MAAELLAPIVEIAITKVISVAQEQINLVLGYKEELRRFCVTLEMARGLLLHAEQKKALGDPGVSVWLKELRRIADEADAVLDEIAYDSLRRKVAGKQIRKQVSNFFTPSNPLAVRRRIASKINDLNAALAEVNGKASGFGLQTILANKRDPERREMIPQTDALLGDPSVVIGRENDAREIARLLVEPSNDRPLAVVSIVGVGGLGKTTLAKLVCNNEEITGYFSKIMWVCVSENFDVFSILVEMLQALSQKHFSKDMTTSQNVVANKIKEELKEKNFLLVLDDVWNEDELKWESLRNCLLGITQHVRRSRILVTTRIPKVASIMGSLHGPIGQLKGEDCWSIIKQRAFGDSFVPLELEEIGREIAMKCRGVPLVANVVGGTLRDAKSKDHWLSITEDFDECGPLDHNERVLQVLKLSFDRLPKPALKQCFAFCSIFRKDLVITKETLVWVWMAQGFLQQPQGSLKKMEVIGEEYLVELVSYAFFQDVEKDPYGGIVYCKMHDLMHDLATSISKSETLLLEDSGTSGFYDIRHLNLICAPSMGPTKTMKVIQELHSLFTQVDVFKNIPVEFKRLLALSFRGADISELPNNLGDLKRLRYLDMSDTKIKEIPKSISRLYLLQTFRFTGCEFIERPTEGIENLFNLKHIQFDNQRLMPAGVGCLSCLQTLPFIVVKHQEGYRIEELGQLNQLRGDLKICNLGLVSNKAEAERAKLFEKAAIRSLNLEFNSYDDVLEGGDHDDDDVLEGLRPHSNLKGFTLAYYRGKSCPGWMFESTGNLGESTCLKNLMSLYFHCCDRMESIPSLLLSKLMKMEIIFCHRLESIELLSLNKSGALTIRNCDSLKSVAISSLKSLEITSCDNLVSVRVGPIAIAPLERIRIFRCKKLETLPVISELPLLKVLDLEWCENLSCIGDSGTSFASTCLVELNIEVCPNLASIPSLKDEVSSLQSLSIIHPQQLESIKWESFLSSTCLKRLRIGGCDGLMHVPNLSGLSSLQSVRIWECPQLISIGGGSSILPSCVRDLYIGSCGVLTSISLDGFSTSSCCLKQMYVSDCGALTSIKPPRVEKLTIFDCPALMSFSLDGFSSSSMCLQELTVSRCPALTTFPNLHGFTSLQRLTIISCSGLRRLPDGLESLLHISFLYLGPFSEELEEFPDFSPIQNLNNSLEDLTLCGWDKLKHLPHQIQHLTALRDLGISMFDKLEALPDWLGNLSSLRELKIQSCNSLMYEPSIEAMQNLSNLEFLEINGCPQLEERYAKDCGTKLDKLSHIPNIRMSYTHVRKGGAPTEESSSRTRKSSLCCWRGQETKFNGCF